MKAAATIVLATVALGAAASHGQNAQYRTTTTRVAVDVSVFSGNTPIPDLAAATLVYDGLLPTLSARGRTRFSRDSPR